MTNMMVCIALCVAAITVMLTILKHFWHRNSTTTSKVRSAPPPTSKGTGQGQTPKPKGYAFDDSGRGTLTYNGSPTPEIIVGTSNGFWIIGGSVALIHGSISPTDPKNIIVDEGVSEISHPAMGKMSLNVFRVKPRTFEHFLNLPRELRDQIYAECVRFDKIERGRRAHIQGRPDIQFYPDAMPMYHLGRNSPGIEGVPDDQLADAIPMHHNSPEYAISWRHNNGGHEKAVCRPRNTSIFCTKTHAEPGSGGLRSVAIFYTNKQVGAEAREVFYKQTMFAVDTSQHRTLLSPDYSWRLFYKLHFWGFIRHLSIDLNSRDDTISRRITVISQLLRHWQTPLLSVYLTLKAESPDFCQIVEKTRVLQRLGDIRVSGKVTIKMKGTRATEAAMVEENLRKLCQRMLKNRMVHFSINEVQTLFSKDFNHAPDDCWKDDGKLTRNKDSRIFFVKAGKPSTAQGVLPAP
ncbi:hypothetical protein EJ08DRAFT_692378 [Tothia fuscella]|uniref:Uncharacterized protein n=1 Tax=Tothia fuscella TaxID=1048955 RepID=A0A9P4P088_9PEZI|nr:hypothetical protein EJ08DRAFT_692378 [Tothia fuscella]